MEQYHFGISRKHENKRMQRRPQANSNQLNNKV